VDKGQCQAECYVREIVLDHRIEADYWLISAAPP
jgi:hypothetical protein